MTDRQQPPERRPIFILKIEGRSDADNIKSLRWVLKRLLRRYGLKCLDAREDVAPEIERKSFKNT